MAVPSTSAGIFADLFSLYMAIALVVGGLVLGWLAYILVRYRAKPGTARPRDAPKAGVLPSERGHPIWSYVMAIVIAGIMFGLAFGTISAVHTLEDPPHDRFSVHAKLEGYQFGWDLTYDGDGGIPIKRSRDWTIPVDTPIVADVTSKDVWHNFALTEFRIRIDVVPGQTNHIWWEAHEPGEIFPVCVQLCGVGHAGMKTNMKIVTMPEWEAYVAAESVKEYAILAKAKQLVNVTYTGGELSWDATGVNETKAYALNITNALDTEATVEVAGREITIPAGATQQAYVPAPAAKKEVTH